MDADPGHTPSRGLALLPLLIMVLSLLLHVPSLTGADSIEEAGLHLRDVQGEDYDVVGKDGAWTGFRWILDNRNQSSTFDVDVEVTMDVEDWKVDVEGDEASIGPGETLIIKVDVRPVAVTERMEEELQVTVTLVEEGTGKTFYLNATATLEVKESHERGLDILFWHVELPDELEEPYIKFGILLLIWILSVYILVRLMIDGGLKRLVARTRTDVDDMILDIIRNPVIVVAIFYGIMDTLKVLEIAREMMGTIEKFFVILSIMVGGYVTYRIIKEVLVYYGNKHAMKTGSEAAKMIVPLIKNVLSVVVVIAALSIMLSYLGYDISVAVASLGIMGLVVAFAAQDTLSNFFSGIHMLLDRPFERGDLIILETGDMYEIKDIGFRSARLYNVVEHVMISLPNNTLANAKVINFTAPDFHYRLKIEVSVAYGSDIERVKSTLMGVAEEYQDIMKEKDFGPSVRFDEFGNSSLNFKLYVWIEDIRENNFLIMNQVRSDLNEGIDAAFRENGIKIPFPQREVWVSSMPGQGIGGDGDPAKGTGTGGKGG